ncbi:hypothetical protein PO909_004195 [Leuciscus waleckii]
MWPFGASFGLGPCSSAFNIHGCRLTDDRNLFNQAHGVMFHHRDIRGDLSNMPEVDMVEYGVSEEEEKNYTIPKKDKLVCWVVSNYNPSYKRSQYFTELVKYIDVEVHGRHFNKRINNDDYTNLMTSCKFYLSFENSIHRDYMTEKLFNPLAIGTVPVVIGPPRENYEQFIPSESFIHVDDFPSPKELADHLKLMDQNEDLYRQYFTWREHFVSKGASFGLAHACRICDHIRRNKDYRVVKDINSWYWG